VVKKPCVACKGTGTIETEREFDVTIPPGTDDGSTRRVAGQGEPGRRGGAAGDLNVIVRVKPHALFRKESGVITCDVPVSAPQAALGAVIDVPTLDGRVEMRVPAGTQSGTIFRLRARGAPEPGGRSGARGDAHVRVVVETPTQLSPEQRDLYEKLAASLRDEQLPAMRSFADKVK
jgi:molecular chaperone DnaJ